MSDLGDWIEHEGGSMPVTSTTRVEVRYRDGSESPDTFAGNFWWGRRLPSSGEQHHDIIAYRVVKP